MNVADRTLAIGRGLAIIRGNKKATTPYLAVALQFRLPQLKAASGSGMFESITKQGLLGVHIPIPSITEQRRITDLLSAMDLATENLRTAQEQLIRLRSAVLFSLLSGELDVPQTYDRFLVNQEASGLGDQNFG
jgi:restriction endonuclease S subunit